MKRWCYGMRKAAVDWEEDYANQMGLRVSEEGVGASTFFYSTNTDVRAVVHGYDFTFNGAKLELITTKANIPKRYDIKYRRMMGISEVDIAEVMMCGTTVDWTKDGVEYEADAWNGSKLVSAELLGQTRALQWGLW